MYEKEFEEYCDELDLRSIDDMKVSAGEIAKKLNANYYGITNDKESHMYIVGSVGRNTAINNCSDLDLLFDLPIDVYKKYNAYESNGQSALLQDVKKVLEERYPRTNLRGDGQVVVIEFSEYTVELVPGFKQSDDRFKYPDTHDGGSWKYTDPLKEQNECESVNESSNGIYYDFCHMMRGWKNNWNFKFPGLLIDTLVYNYFKENDYYKESSYDDYLDILKGLFEYIKSQDEEQSYWHAVGSNQYVYNPDNGKFIKKAKDAAKKIDEAKTEEDITKALTELFGDKFKNTLVETNSISKNYTYSNTEEFIEKIFPVDIRYSLEIDCKVSQDGFREFFLRKALCEHQILRHNKSLKFFIDYTDVPEPYSIYWKVRNVGEIAERKNQIRGQIKKTNLPYQIEKTSFYGSHYVECYIIKNYVCVARSRIEVPIGQF